MAVVEKCVASTGRPSSVVIGKLRATAIIGDISLAGSSLPRPASVRATAFTEILRIPAAAVLFVAGRYPGALGGIAYRLKEVGNNLQMRLPMRSEVIESLDVFAGTEESFKKEVLRDFET
ncbi:SKOR [Symbiodinium sp. CCMP2456]|nr:SKOR [Symbiodinium sp. CCMP2456]